MVTSKKKTPVKPARKQGVPAPAAVAVAAATATAKRPRKPAMPTKPLAPPGLGTATAGLTLGQRIRRFRRQRDWSLNQLAEACDIAPSTLSKVENDILTLNYDRLSQVAVAFGVSLSEFLAEQGQRVVAPRAVMARRSLFRHDQGEIVNTPNYEYRYLCTDLVVKGMVPIFSVVHARSLEEFGELLRHEGEELVFVVKGRVTVHTEFYSPELLDTLQGVYIDSTMGHAYVNSGPGEAWILSVNTGAIPIARVMQKVPA
jgi:transcriptional regulator with XRE-family HTH domain